MFKSDLLKEETKPVRIREFISDMKEEKFDPRSYLTSQFRFNFSDNENSMIESLKSQLEAAEHDLKIVEKEIEKEKEDLKTKEELEQTNNFYQLQNVDFEFKDLVKEISNLTQSVGLEHEQIKTIGEELNELNSVRDEKLMLNEIMDVFGFYNQDQDKEDFLEKNFREGKANNLIVKLDCLKSALDTLNYKEFASAKQRINEDFEKAKQETLKQFKNFLKISDYKEARKMFNFIEKIGESERAEKVYEEILMGERGPEYGITEKKQNMREFITYLFTLGIHLQQFQQDDSVFVAVHGDRGLEMLSRVSARVMRDRINNLASRLLGGCIKEGKTEFFLYYLDEMTMRFEEFRKKNNQMEKIWSILESLSEAYKDIAEKYQTMYFEIEKNELSHYLEQKIILKLGDVKKCEEKAKASKDEDVSTLKLKEIDKQISSEEVEVFVNRAKLCIGRCFRNSLAHMRADNCGDLLILFINKLTEYLNNLIEMAEKAIPDPLDPNPARIQLFSIVSKVLILTRRVDLFFLEFKTKITNMFKLDEAEKVKMQSLKILSEKISGTLNFAMRNLFAEVSQVWRNFKKKKKKKKIKDFESASPLAKALCDLLGAYLDFIFNNFNMEQKVNLMKVVGVEFIKYLERNIPTEKYSQNELIKLNIDIEEYDDQLFDFIDEEEVSQRKENLTLLVNLLKVPWALLENYIEENDVYKRVEKKSLDLFIRCVRRMSKK